MPVNASFQLVTAVSVVLFALHGTGEADGCAGGREIEGAYTSPNGSVLLTPELVGPISFHRSMPLLYLRAPFPFAEIRIGADIDGSWGGRVIYANDPDGVSAIAEGAWVDATDVPRAVRGTIFIQGLPRILDPEEYTDVAIDWKTQRKDGQICHDGTLWYWRTGEKERE